MQTSCMQQPIGPQGPAHTSLKHTTHTMHRRLSLPPLSTMAMKPEQRIRADAPSAMSDYPDEISDTTGQQASTDLPSAAATSAPPPSPTDQSVASMLPLLLRATWSN